MEQSGGIQSGLSGRYATALFELARDEGRIDAVAASLQSLRTALAESPELVEITRNPAVSRDNAVRGVAAVAVSLGLDPMTSNFLGVLARNRRLAVLPQIIGAFGRLASAHRGETTAEVTSAHPLDEIQVGHLRQTLRQRLGREVAVDLRVDPAILGGLVVRIGSRMIDNSIRTKLNTLAHAMKG